MQGEDTPDSLSAAAAEWTGDAPPVVTLFRRYLPDRVGVFALAVASTFVHQLLGLVPPFLLGATIDAFFTGDRASLSLPLVPGATIPATTRGQFLFVAGLFLATAVAIAATRVVVVTSIRWLQQATLHAVRTDAYAATQDLDVAFFDATETGDVMSVLSNDVTQLRTLLGDWLRRTVELATLVLGLLVVMVGLHPQFTLLVVLFVPAMVALVAGYQRAVEPRYDARRAAIGALNAHLGTAVGGVETIKIFGGESRETGRFRERSRSFWRADWAAARLSAVFSSTRAFVIEGASLAIVVVGGWWALFGPPLWFTAPLTTGTFVTFLFYGRRLVSQSAELGDLVDTYADANASARRVLGLLAITPSITDPDDPTSLAPVNGRVTFRTVTFTYPGNDEPTLRRVDVDVEPGEFVGLVGPTGAGKSTLLKLLLRFHDPDSGTVAVDGSDVTAARLDDLRDAIGYVGQDPSLFDRSVRANIAYGAPDATDEAVRAAARRANAHGFITDLPEGYDTQVGERGVRLSGGQRQRLAIARAILVDPDVLVLDEATSHVDAHTERLIQESLADLIRGRTTIAVAHRLSTVRDADRILVVEDGELVEQGTHETLVDAGGIYADLWRLHVGETAVAGNRETTPDPAPQG